MEGRILYAGDTSLTGAASYLAGILSWNHLEFDYLASNQPIRLALETSQYDLYVISDYPALNWREEDFETVVGAVKKGAGLLMIGGWESFHGQLGEYVSSPLEKILPVEMCAGDDRVNSSQPWLIEKILSHPIVEGLPFDENPTYVGGFNRVKPAENAKKILNLRRVSLFRSDEGQFGFRTDAAEPLLMVGSAGSGRTAAFASDVAPHWVGGFVDWGAGRITAEAEGAEQVEIGSDYAEFFFRLIQWTMGTLG